DRLCSRVARGGGRVSRRDRGIGAASAQSLCGGSGRKPAQCAVDRGDVRHPAGRFRAPVLLDRPRHRRDDAVLRSRGGRGAGPPGYLVTEVSHDSAAFVLAFDPEGRIRWYQRIPIHPDESAMETKQLPNGDFTVYVGASTGWQPVGGRYIEFRPDGTIVRVYTAGAPYYTDNHELVVTMTGDGVTAAHLFGYDLRTLDLTALGGRPDQLVARHAILRQSASGVTEFLWNAWDHFSLADWVFVPPNLGLFPSIDFDHPNSLAIDRDGNYVVSFAMLGEIAKIDAVT